MASDHRDGFSLRLYRTFLVLLLCAWGAVPVAAAKRDQGPPELAVATGARSAALPLRAPWNTNWAVSDLNGDAWPDSIRTESTDRGYRVNINLSGSAAVHSIEIPAAQFAGLNVETRDIDGDDDLDLVITAGLVHRPVGLWINDGNGGFTKTDSSLYSDQVWQASPSVGSNPSSTDNATDLFNSFSSSDSCQLNLLPEPPAQQRASFFVSPAGYLPVFLSGQLYVRPPPFLS